MTNTLAIFFPVFETNAENLNNAKKENKHREQYNK